MHSRKNFEVERKFRVLPKEYPGLQAKLEREGFELVTTSVITDTLLSTDATGDTERVRREQLLNGDAPDVCFFETQKTHTLIISSSAAKQGKKAGKGGRKSKKKHPTRKARSNHVREETEEKISADSAEDRIARAIHERCAPLPAYSKTRRLYRGKVKGYEASVALDLAQGLGSYSGYYIEIEILLPLDAKPKTIVGVQRIIIQFARKLLGDKRKPQPSYRKMLLRTVASAVK